jgi:hypothetical protein
MSQQEERARRLANLRALIGEYEAERGLITDAEMAEQVRADRDAAASARRPNSSC